MIVSFGNKLAEHIFDGEVSKETRKLDNSLHRIAYKKLLQLNACTNIETLRVPPGNDLKKMDGEYKGYWRIKINNQWRIKFKWENSNAYDVEIVDYH